MTSRSSRGLFARRRRDVRWPVRRAFFKGGHNEITGNQAICVEKDRLCVVFLSNDVRAEGLFQRLTEATLGDPGMPWTWENYTPYDRQPPRK